MKILSDIIEDAVNSVPNSVYLRASDVEANTNIANIPLAGRVFFLFKNEPEFSAVGEMQQTYEATIELQVMKLAEYDNNTVKGDDIREELLPFAESVYSIATEDVRTSLMEYSDSMNVSFSEEIKLYDSILTGLTISFNIFIDRNNFC